MTTDKSQNKPKKNKRIFDADDYYKTLGWKKVWLYFNYELLRSTEFQNDVTELRKQYLSENSEVKTERKIEFHDACEALSRKYNLDPIMWGCFIQYYITTNKLNYERPYVSCCHVRDIADEVVSPYEPDTIKNWLSAYPISIDVSPYASMREIIDFVEKMYKSHIEPYQLKYRRSDIKLGKIKKRKKLIQERNDFIYEMRNLPRKDIMRLINDKFGAKLGFIDYAYVGKIISLEKKRRKEV